MQPEQDILREQQFTEIKRVIMLNKEQMGVFTDPNYCIGWIAGILNYKS